MTASIRKELVAANESASAEVGPSHQYEAEEEGREELHDDEGLSGPFPGGPTDTSVIKCFDTHVAHLIWKTNERPILRCLQHTSKLKMWDLAKESHRFRLLVKGSGLFVLCLISYNTINRVLISALVERWYPETNSFHLPFGEITITLDDVHRLTGLSVTGKAVTSQDLDFKEIVRLCVKSLGIDEDEVREELNRQGANGKAVRMEWLRDKLSGLPEDATDDNLYCSVRGYLLYLLGCTIFSDKTGRMVNIKYLQLLMDLEKVETYAWGAATLSYLYRQLGVASRSGVRQITGYLPLLEAWCYEHIKLERPNPNPTYNRRRPRATRWEQPRSQPVHPESKLIAFREALDDLPAEGVIWDPYHDDRDLYPRPITVFYSGCLFCFNIIEPYNPERVLRQFGHVQSIPPEPMTPTTNSKRGATANRYIVTYSADPVTWNRNQNHQLAFEARGPVARRPGDCVPGYLQWYDQITHRFVQNPKHRRGAQDYHCGVVEDFHYKTIELEDWREHRDKALALLEESLVAGENQEVASMLEREKLIYKELRFDHLVPDTLTPPQREHDLDSLLIKQSQEGWRDGKRKKKKH